MEDAMNQWTELSERLQAVLKKAENFIVIVEARRTPATRMLWRDDAVVTASRAVLRP
jgi:hypothetical protein